MLGKSWQNLDVFTPKCDFNGTKNVILMACDPIPFLLVFIKQIQRKKMIDVLVNPFSALIFS